MEFWHWLAHLTGAATSEGSSYNFWSGFGADLGEIAFFGAALGLYRKHNCHVKGCWRIAKQQVENTSWIVCHKHHPAGAPTPEALAKAQQRHLDRLAEIDKKDLVLEAALKDDDASTSH